MKVTAIILTLNEEVHIARCIESIKNIVNEILVVDSFSTDRTVSIAKKYGAKIIENKFINYSTQFNFALNQLSSDTDWVMRIDADEYLTKELNTSMLNALLTVERHNVSGFNCDRRMAFQGKLIKYGGIFPIKVLRLFRYGHGKCEDRWMDEHIIVSGPTMYLSGELIDDNLNTLTWWTNKHNYYANRQVVDLLNLKYNLIPKSGNSKFNSNKQSEVKRWINEMVYSRLPKGLRAFLYFLYRYIFFLGFLDGREGAIFHFLQGFWYRFLVDAKESEVLTYMKKNQTTVNIAIKKILGIDIDNHN